VQTDPLNLVGHTLAGRFRVERRVAEGGFGVVYRGHQVALDRPVALKVLKTPDPAHAAAFQGIFEVEARTIARLRHPNIVEVHDFGHTLGPTGQPLLWMALEWLEGRTLEAALADRQSLPSPQQVLTLLRPVFQAVGFAHRQQVAHRDIKPANVFITECDGRVKVLDFGIAKIMAGVDSTPEGATTRGVPAFSPDYAAPEQVARARTGPWTDVHALGLLVTEALTGRPPYAHGGGDLFSAVLSSLRPTPALYGVDASAWEAVLARAMAQRPADRHQSADELLEALESGVTRPSPPTVRIASARRGRRLVVAVAGALALIAGTGWTLRVPSSRRVMMAVLPFENLTGDPAQEYFSDGLTEEMIGQLGRVQPGRLAVIARTSVTPYKLHGKSVREIGRELHVDYVLESSVQRSQGRVKIAARLIQVSDETPVWADSYERAARDVLAMQTEIAIAIASGVRLKLSPAEAAAVGAGRSRDPAAYDAYLRGRYFWDKKSADGYRQALLHFQRATELDPSYAAAYAGLADVHSMLGIDVNALAKVDPTASPGQAFDRAKQYALKAIQLDEGLADAHSALGFVLILHDWDWDEAARHFRRALELDPNNMEAHRRHGQLYLASLGRAGESIAELQRAVELAPLSVSANVFLGRTYYWARRYDEASVHLRRALELDPDGGWNGFLAYAYAQKGLFPEALAEAGKCGAACLPSAAYVHARAGHTEEALRILGQVTGPAGHTLPNAVARVYAALGRPDDAMAWLEKAYQVRDYYLIFLRIEPGWDPLRSDPRFADLIRRVGIP
jgi:TolB-like protein